MKTFIKIKKFIETYNITTKQKEKKGVFINGIIKTN